VSFLLLLLIQETKIILKYCKGKSFVLKTLFKPPLSSVFHTFSSDARWMSSTNELDDDQWMMHLEMLTDTESMEASSSYWVAVE
jgi:hypothetical protein